METKSISEFYNELVNEVANFSSLSDLPTAQENAVKLMADLNTGSQVSIFWRLILWIVAFASWTQYNLYLLFLDEVTEREGQTVIGTDAWLIEKCKEFEFGNNTLTVINNRTAYATSDPELRCIDAVALRQDRILTYILVATRNSGTGKLEKLPAEKRDAFRTYLKRGVQLPGTNLEAISYEPDRVKFTATILYDGLLPWTPIQEAILTAVEAYLDGLSAKSLDGFVEDELLTDAIQKTPGVKKVGGVEVQGRSATGAYAPNVSVVGYQTLAGYCILDRDSCVLNPQPI